MKKLIPALALLLISAVLLGTSSFAWFSMNTTVTVTGMSVSTRVDSNLLIADGVTYAAAPADGLFEAPSLNQTVSAQLEPVSSTDGVHFFYHATSNVSGTGAATDSTFIAYSEAAMDGGWTDQKAIAAAAGRADYKYSAAFNTNYGNTVSNTSTKVLYGYVDYVLYLKATNSDLEHNQIVKLTDCLLSYNGGAVSDKAWRVAVFYEAVAAEAAGHSDVADMTLATIIGLDGADYFTDDEAISAIGGTTASVSHFGDEAEIGGNIASGATQRYKVVVRLWLEGEDETCNNDTYANLDKNYTLSLQFKLDQDANINGVEEIATAAFGAVATSDANVASVALNATALKYETAASYQWKNAVGDANIGGATAATYTNEGGEAMEVYCVVTTNLGHTYTSGHVNLTAAP